MKNGNLLIKVKHQQNVDNSGKMLIEYGLKIKYPQTYKHLWITLFTFSKIVNNKSKICTSFFIYQFLNLGKHLSQIQKILHLKTYSMLDFQS